MLQNLQRTDAVKCIPECEVGRIGDKIVNLSAGNSGSFGSDSLWTCQRCHWLPSVLCAMFSYFDCIVICNISLQNVYIGPSVQLFGHPLICQRFVANDANYSIASNTRYLAEELPL